MSFEQFLLKVISQLVSSRRLGAANSEGSVPQGLVLGFGDGFEKV